MSGDLARIVVVCTGNIARSPLAEKLLEHEARERLGPNGPVWVSSAGVHGLDGHAAVEEMRREASDRGLDLSRHRAQVTERTLLDEADIVLTMTEAQRRSVLQLAPSTRDRTFTLKELARLVRSLHDLPQGSDGAARIRDVVRLAHGARAYVAAADGREDVADPYGGTAEGYRRCAAEIEDLVDAVAPALFGERPA